MLIGAISETLTEDIVRLAVVIVFTIVIAYLFATGQPAPEFLVTTYTFVLGYFFKSSEINYKSRKAEEKNNNANG